MRIDLYECPPGGPASLVAANLVASNVQWTRRMSQPGEFSIALIGGLPAPWPGRYLVTLEGEDEVGVIEKVDAEEAEGESVSISGRFAESLWSRWSAGPNGARAPGANPRQALTAALQVFHMSDLPTVVMGEGTERPAGQAYLITIEAGKPATDMLYAIAESQGLFPSIGLDWETGSLVARIREGVDRTTGQSENPIHVFSLAMGTAGSFTYSGDYSVACSEVLAYGAKGSEEDEVSFQSTVPVPGFDSATQWAARAFEDVSSLIPDEPQQSDVQSAGELRAYDHRPQLAIDSSVAGTGYKTLWDLGDVCSAEIPALGLSCSERIEEVRIVEKADGVTVEATLGTKEISKIQRAVMRGR